MRPGEEQRKDWGPGRRRGQFRRSLGPSDQMLRAGALQLQAFWRIGLDAQGPPALAAGGGLGRTPSRRAFVLRRATVTCTARRGQRPKARPVAA